MGTLRAIAAAAMLVLAPSARADTVTRWRAFTAEASLRFGVPRDWIERVIRLESGGLTRRAGRPITSAKGAMGLMQLMPATWSAMRNGYRLGPDPYDPHDNILAGTAYLRAMYDRFGYPGLFGAYNAGPQRYAAYLSGQLLPSETRAYLAAAAPGVAPQVGGPVVGRPPAIFAVRARQPGPTQSDATRSDFAQPGSAPPIVEGQSVLLFAIKAR